VHIHKTDLGTLCGGLGDLGGRELEVGADVADLAAMADRDREACEGRAALGIAELGVVGDVSD
jgi:hypothetical protein